MVKFIKWALIILFVGSIILGFQNGFLSTILSLVLAKKLLIPMVIFIIGDGIISAINKKNNNDYNNNNNVPWEFYDYSENEHYDVFGNDHENKKR